MSSIDVEDNAVVNNVIEVLYEVVAPKKGRYGTLSGLIMPVRCTPPMTNRPTFGVQHCLCTKRLKCCQFNRGRKKTCNNGTV